MWRNVPALRARVDPSAAEDEFRAQIERALASGIDATHLDTHMGAAARAGAVGDLSAARPGVPAAGAAAARDDRLSRRPQHGADDRRRLRRRTERGGAARRLLRDDAERSALDTGRYYEGVIQATKPGRTFLALHANAPGDIETIVPVAARAQQRIDEYRLFKGRAFTEFAAAHGVTTIGMRALRDELRGGRR